MRARQYGRYHQGRKRASQAAWGKLTTPGKAVVDPCLRVADTLQVIRHNPTRDKAKSRNDQRVYHWDLF